MEHKTIYLVFSQTYTVPSRMVKLFTNKPYSHVSLSFDNTFDCMYSFGRRRKRNFLIGGFVKENLKEGIFNFNKNAHCAIFTLIVTLQQEEKIKAFIHKIELADYQYNMLGVLLIPFHIRFQRQNKYYCSEFIYTALCDANIIDDDKKIIVPEHLMRIKELVPYHTGNIQDFTK